ncbi:hypothetical protein [Allocoleopsis sp.]
MVSFFGNCDLLSQIAMGSEFQIRVEHPTPEHQASILMGDQDGFNHVKN